MGARSDEKHQSLLSPPCQSPSFPYWQSQQRAAGKAERRCPRAANRKGRSGIEGQWLNNWYTGFCFKLTQLMFGLQGAPMVESQRVTQRNLWVQSIHSLVHLAHYWMASMCSVAGRELWIGQVLPPRSSHHTRACVHRPAGMHTYGVNENGNREALGDMCESREFVPLGCLLWMVAWKWI